MDGSDDLIVEIDVILPRASTLHFAHDLGETIQCMLERYVRYRSPKARPSGGIVLILLAWTG